ncbi:hypothetical protein QR680_004060 [Steinernema hermaphroditum]|uniref:Uncharacterized protein n=1 Tax=Steinernema hermaphroditum TaxID=289476 RepID=A0AA39HMJ4_9BILA|nr:hypothetical protein QR680_004060 [Steinernema hermaphroditum]
MIGALFGISDVQPSLLMDSAPPIIFGLLETINRLSAAVEGVEARLSALEKVHFQSSVKFRKNDRVYLELFANITKKLLCHEKLINVTKKSSVRDLNQKEAVTQAQIKDVPIQCRVDTNCKENQTVSVLSTVDESKITEKLAKRKQNNPNLNDVISSSTRPMKLRSIKEEDEVEKESYKTLAATDERGTPYIQAKKDKEDDYTKSKRSKKGTRLSSSGRMRRSFKLKSITEGEEVITYEQRNKNSSKSLSNSHVRKRDTCCQSARHYCNHLSVLRNSKQCCPPQSDFLSSTDSCVLGEAMRTAPVHLRALVSWMSSDVRYTRLERDLTLLLNRISPDNLQISDVVRIQIRAFSFHSPDAQHEYQIKFIMKLIERALTSPPEIALMIAKIIAELHDHPMWPFVQHKKECQKQAQLLIYVMVYVCSNVACLWMNYPDEVMKWTIGWPEQFRRKMLRFSKHISEHNFCSVAWFLYCLQNHANLQSVDLQLFVAQLFTQKQVYYEAGQCKLRFIRRWLKIMRESSQNEQLKPLGSAYDNRSG